MESNVDLVKLYRQRTSTRRRDRLLRFLTTAGAFHHEPKGTERFPTGAVEPLSWRCVVEGYVNVDLFAMGGVDVAANAELLPFAAEVFQRIECDAVLEHVRYPEKVMSEMYRVLAPGGYLHIVTPFCHPFHQYPKDFRRYTIDGLKQLSEPMEVVAEGWRTGPAATVLVFTIEFIKLLLPFRVWRGLAHVVFGWLLFPLRYLDLMLLRYAEAGRMGNHCYVWLRKAPAINSMARGRTSGTYDRG